MRAKLPTGPLNREYYHRRLTEWVCNNADEVLTLIEDDDDQAPAKNEKDIFIDNYFLTFIHIH
ncbi:hypothetical protein [Negadavirga shengliensis]|uniref:Uncharacterized protein n=1 Tax=Negadavirga shengliensis TaxID=1389218 RepID=A0ABV9T7I3_9BACT